MTTRNYNAALPRKVLITMLTLGAMTVEEISAMCDISTPEDEERLLHVLACHRYKSLMQDEGSTWKLTDAGIDYATWAARYPQRFRRMKGEAFDPKYLHDADVLLSKLRQSEANETRTKPI